jgi:1-acyl-sn-glycerol-3-phosphate acyltransferase
MKLRALAFNAVLVSSGLLLSIWCFITFRHRTENGVIQVAKLWCRISLAALRAFCGITVAAEGLELVPKTGGVIIAAQHQSELDILIWITRLPRPAFVFKQELRKLPVFGALLVPGGMIPVNRGGGSAALQSMLAGCGKALEKGYQVVIFPEGTRTPPGTRGTLRNGIFALAQASGAPVLPAATDSGLRWGPDPMHKIRGVAQVKLYPPLPELRREAFMAALAEVFYEHGVSPPPPAP